MIVKSKLALRRVRNRKNKNKLVAVWSGANQIVDSNTTMPSFLQGYRWVRKPNPNDGAGFSWHEEPISISKLSDEQRNNMFKVHDNVTY